MLTSTSSRLFLNTTTAASLHRVCVRSYFSSSSSSSASSSSYGYTAYTNTSDYSSSSSSSSSSSFSSNVVAPMSSPSSVVAPLSCMNRNARKPSKANHGARPNSSYNRKNSSPEFGSWRHPGLRPGQSPAPRPQPGTPMTIASSAVGKMTGPTPQQAQPQAPKKEQTQKQA